MQLSQLQKDVLTVVQFNVHAPMHDIAKRCGIREHSARYALQRLVELKIVKPASFVDVYPFGIRDHAVFLSLTGLSPVKLQAFVQYCTRSELVSWLSEIGGDFQYALALKSRDILTVHNFLGEIVKEFGNILLEKTTATRVSLTEFGLRSLSSKRGAVTTLDFGKTESPRRLSPEDHALLSALCEMPGIVPAELARRLGIPSSTLHYQQAALESAGIIVGYRYLIDWKALGLQRFRLLVSVRGVSSEFGKRLKKCCEQFVFCALFLECIGSWDYEIELVAQDPLEVRKFCEILNNEFGAELNWTRVFTIFEEVKFCSYPFSKSVP